MKNGKKLPTSNGDRKISFINCILGLIIIFHQPRTDRNERGRYELPRFIAQHPHSIGR